MIPKYKLLLYFMIALLSFGVYGIYYHDSNMCSNSRSIGTSKNTAKIIILESTIKKNDINLLAQLVMAEAGNQDLIGKRYVVSVVLNRVKDSRFPNTVPEVIFDEYQFSVIKDGAFERHQYDISNDCYQAIIAELEEQIDPYVLYFSSTEEPINGLYPFKHQDHWFSY